MDARELIHLATDHDAEVLQAHPIDALVDRWDELDERNDRAVEHLERFRQEDLGHRPPVPDVLEIGGGVPFQEGPDVDVLVPVGDPICEMAELVRHDVDAARGQPVALQLGERAIVAEDVLDQAGHCPAGYMPPEGEPGTVRLA